MASVTNKSKGPRGIAGKKPIMPGETAELELSEDEELMLSEMDGVEVSKAAPKKAKKDAE